jgi:hypothetical protein
MLAHPSLPSKKKKHQRAVRARYQASLKILTPEQKKEREQWLLWHRLHTVFTKVEYITYENLPENLRVQLHPFEEFIYPAQDRHSQAL